MVKQLTGKRRIIGLIIGILLLLALAGGYVVYNYSNKKQAPVVNTAAKEEVAKLNLKGDQTLAAQYASALKEDDAESAQAVFDDAVEKTDNKEEKLNLLAQNVSLALAYKQHDAATKAALAATQLNPSFATYNDAFRVYTVVGNHAKQKEMLQKAIDALQSSDDSNKDQILPVLRQQMTEVEQQISGVGTN